MKAKKGLKITGFKLESRTDPKTGTLIITSRIDPKTGKEIIKKKREGGILITDNIPILVDFKFDGQRVIYPIGYRVDIDKWNAKEQRVKRGKFNKDFISSSVINRRINQIEINLPEIYNEAIEQNKPITSKFLIKELNSFLKIAEGSSPEKEANKASEEHKNVIDYVTMFVESESEKKNWSSGTKTRMNNFKNYLTNYNPNFDFEDITDEFLSKIIKHNSETLKYKNATNQKVIKNFKWFLNWATKKGYNTNLAYKLFEYKFKGVTTSDYQQNIIFLSWDELQHLNNFDFSDNEMFVKYKVDFSTNKSLEKIRDIYCFCCFTSLRYSDLAHLKKNDVKTDNNGSYYLDITTVKTDDKLTIELNKYALAIWNKYKDVELKNNRLFPVPANQTYNEYLKIVAKLAEFSLPRPTTPLFGSGWPMAPGLPAPA